MSPEPTLLYRIDPTKRRYRRYCLSVEPALFGTALVRNFGRMPTRLRSHSAVRDGGGR